MAGWPCCFGLGTSQHCGGGSSFSSQLTEPRPWFHNPGLRSSLCCGLSTKHPRRLGCFEHLLPKLGALIWEVIKPWEWNLAGGNMTSGAGFDVLQLDPTPCPFSVPQLTMQRERWLPGPVVLSSCHISLYPLRFYRTQETLSPLRCLYQGIFITATERKLVQLSMTLG